MDFIGVFLHKQANMPLYYQLYKKLAEDIRTGKLPPGEKLPGKRNAAQQLGISINTVDAAYQMLSAEGYLQAMPKSGFFVSKIEQLPPPAAKATPSSIPGAGGVPPHAERGQNSGNGKQNPQQGPAALPTGESFTEKGKPPAQGGQPGWVVSFYSGGQDLTLFPQKTWARLVKEQLAQNKNMFARSVGQGEESLRCAVTGYLGSYRGVRCSAGQIVLGAGLEVLVGMLARLLVGRVFALESPGYPKTGQILQNMGLAMCSIAVDEHGMQPDLLQKSAADVAYVTPSHQFPTGGIMPVGRRMALLRWADGKNKLIIEDDYDSEFRFDGRPLPCLQGLDEGDKVVYAGTFTRSLAPGIRAAYLVLPPALCGQWHRAYAGYACTISRPEQHALAAFLQQGHFARSLNRSRAAYRQRRDILLAAIQQTFCKGSYLVENSHTGLFLVLRLPQKNAMLLAASARQSGIYIQALQEYGGQGPAAPNANALLLGYGGIANKDILPAVQLLWQVIANN